VGTPKRSSKFPECTPLRERDLKNVGEVVLAEAPMPLFSLGNIPSSDTAIIEAKLYLTLHDCHLKPDVESVFGTLGYGRLIYGEMKNHQFELLWDSVPLPAGVQINDLRDMNGDGVKEILLEWQEGGGQSYTGLAIFDLHGNELDPGPSTGSFLGEDIKYDLRPDGTVEVVISSGSRTDRYTLVNDGYVPEKPPKQSQHKPQTQPSKP
jgi:hypothetical protein